MLVGVVVWCVMPFVDCWCVLLLGVVYVLVFVCRLGLVVCGLLLCCVVFGVCESCVWCVVLLCGVAGVVGVCWCCC